MLYYIFTTKVIVDSKIVIMPLKALTITPLIVVTTLGVSRVTSIKDINL